MNYSSNLELNETNVQPRIHHLFNSQSTEDHSYLENQEAPEEGCLVKTLFAAIHLEHNDTLLPKISSDEICGTILNIGSKVPQGSGLNVGDIVILFTRQSCNQCENCSNNTNSQFCSKITCAFHSLVVDGSPSWSALYEVSSIYCLDNWKNSIRLPTNIPGHIGCLLPTTALQVYSAILETIPLLEIAIRLKGYANLLIVGGNHFYLPIWTIYFIQNLFCNKNVKIIYADFNENGIAVANEAGADDVVLLNINSSLEDMSKSATMDGYNKIDLVLDGICSDLSFSLGISCLNVSGTLVIINSQQDNRNLILKNDNFNVSLNLVDFIKNYKTVKSVGPGSKSQLLQMIDLISIQGLHSLSIYVEVIKNEDILETERLVKILKKENKVLDRIVISFH